MSEPSAACQFARDVVVRLQAQGFTAYWAGGCVRDRLLGESPKDYDVATSATPDQVQALFGRRRTRFIGAAFGVVAVDGPRAAGTLEVATFRRDDAYSDGRHPDRVFFSHAEDDAQRRDFTINGMFFDPVADRVIDYVGGQQDLVRQVIRCIGDPHRRFEEDKLRMLRALRFATTLGFHIDPQTMAAIQMRADEIGQVSSERIAAEMRRILTHPRAVSGLELLRTSKLQRTVLPEYSDDCATPAAHRWHTMIAIVSRLAPAPDFATALAAVLWPLSHTIGERATVQPLMTRWRLTNQEAKDAEWLLQHVTVVQHAVRLPWPQVQRTLVHPLVSRLLALSEAVILATQGPQANLEGLQYCRERLAWPAERLNPAPLVNGHDLQRAGVPAGPELGRWLDEIRDAQLEGLLSTAEEAVAWVRKQQPLRDDPGQSCPAE
jgi:poly(A) polymerase